MRKPSAEAWNEWHCVVIGFGEGMNPRKPKVPYPKEVVLMIADEYWYYMTGLGLAGLFWGGLIVGVIIFGLWAFS